MLIQSNAPNAQGRAARPPLACPSRIKLLPGLLLSLMMLTCGAEKTLEIQNSCFRVEAYVDNPGALGLATVTFDVRQAPGQMTLHSRPLVIMGSGNVAAKFLTDSLLLVKPDAQAEEPTRFHVLLRLPMEHERKILLDNSPDDLRLSDSAYATDTLAFTRVSYCQAPGRPEVHVIWYHNPVKNEEFQAILLAPVDRLSGHLLDEETLQLDVLWKDIAAPEAIIVKLPTTDREEFEYAMVEMGG